MNSNAQTETVGRIVELKAGESLPVKFTPPKPPVAVGARGIQITDFESLWRFSNAVAKSGLAPKGIEKPEAIFTAIQMGLEVGLSPMAALQNTAVINGRAAVYGDAQLAIVRASGELEVFNEWYEVGGKRIDRNPTKFDDDTAAVCNLKRAGYEPTTFAFSVADAKRAQLWGKPGPWTQYPARMLRFRARSFVLRDNFGDALKGLLTVEEAGDLAPMKPAMVMGDIGQLSPDGGVQSSIEHMRHQIVQVCSDGPSNDSETAAGAQASRIAEAAASPQEPGPTRQLTPQDKLATKVLDAGHTFDDWRKWALVAYPTDKSINDSIPGFADVPTAVVRRCLLNEDMVGEMKALV